MRKTERQIEKTLADFNDMLNFSANNTRKWVNRGATPKELFERFHKPLMKDLPKTVEIMLF